MAKLLDYQRSKRLSSLAVLLLLAGVRVFPQTVPNISSRETSVADFGAVPDMVTGTDGILDGTSFISATAHFTSRDTGKLIFVAGAGSFGRDFQTTIYRVVNTDSVLLSTAARTAVHNASYSYGTDDFPAMQGAIDAAAGGTLYIPGNPQQCYALSSSLLISSSKTRVHGDGASSCLMNIAISAKDGDGASVIAIHDRRGSPLSDIEVDHLQLSNAGSTYVLDRAGVALLEITGPITSSVANVKFHDLTLSTHNRECLTNGSTLDHFRVENNLFKFCAEGGLYLAGKPSNGVVRGNRFLGGLGSTAGSAIRVKNSTDIEVTGNFIAMKGYGNSGIQFVDYLSTRPRVLGNVITAFDQPGSSGVYFGFTTDGEIRENTIIGSVGTAIYLAFTKIGPGRGGAVRTFVDHNTLEGCHSWGIAATGVNGHYASDVVITANRLVDCVNGIQIDKTEGQVEVSDNTIFRATRVGGAASLSIFGTTPAATHSSRNSVINYESSGAFADGVSRVDNRELSTDSP
jgi:hypothetical protein